MCSLMLPAQSTHYIYTQAAGTGAEARQREQKRSRNYNYIDMSEKRKLQKSRHDAYVKEQGKKVVTYLVATLIILFVLVFVATIIWWG